MTDREKIESDLLNLVRNFLSEIEAERALQSITLNASLERDLSIDSLGKVELLHRIEKTFSIHLPDIALTKTDTLNDLLEIILKTKPEFPSAIKAQTFAPILKPITLDLSSTNNIIDVLNTYAKSAPKRIHLYLQDEQGNEETITYGELFEKSKNIARGLLARNIQQGETIAIMLPTGKEFFYTFLGILLIGAIPVPIYPPFRPDRIEEYAKREAKILQNAEARILITFAQAEFLSKLLRTFIPSLKEVTTVHDLQIKAGELPKLDLQPNDPALIQYTSGSTGDPKGVLLTHENILANINAMGQTIPIVSTDVGVTWLPLYHDMGLISWLTSLYFGFPGIVLSPITFLTRPERWLWAIHYHRATLAGGPNFAYELCIKKINPEHIEGLDLSSWKFAFNGAEAVNPNTLRNFSKKFAPYGFQMESFAPVYGLAEVTVALAFPTKRRKPKIDRIEREAFENKNSAIANTSSTNTLEFVACGTPVPHHEIRIVDESGTELAERMIGEIQFKGPSAMQGYFNNPEATRKAYHNGWWVTGDLGYKAENELYVTGRKKDIIIKAGRHIYPDEIEDVIGQLEGIRKGCVVAFGVSDKTTGTEKLIVIAETRNLTNQQKQRLRAEITDKLSILQGISADQLIFASPHTIPKTSSGKLQRSLAKSLYIQGKLKGSKLPAILQFAKIAAKSFLNKVSSYLFYFAKCLYALYVAIILILTVSPLWLSLFIFKKETAAKLCQIWARNLFRLVGCPMTIEGMQNLKEMKNMIFVSNHASYIDSVILMGILPPSTIFTVKKELFTTKVMSAFVKKLKYLSVDRLDLSQSLADKNQIAEMVSEGQSVIIFPEGTFSYATGLRAFKSGAFVIAAETNTPVCPIAIQDSRNILRGSDLLPWPGKIKVTIGKPIYPEGNDWREVNRLQNLVRTEIAKHCGEPSFS